MNLAPKEPDFFFKVIHRSLRNLAIGLWLAPALMYFGLDNMSNVQPTKALLFDLEIYFSSVPRYIGILCRLHDSCIFVHLSTSRSIQKKSMQIIFTRGSYIHEMYMYLHTLQNKYTLSFCYL